MSTARGFLGCGDGYIERFDPATQLYLPPRGPFELTKFAIKATTKLEEMTGRGRTTYGQILASVAIPQPTEFEIEVAEVNREAMALATLGTVATFTQSSATVTDEAVSAAATLGDWVPLAKHSITAASVVVTNSAATTTYVEGQDYEINYSLGWIRALVGGTITAGQALKVDYAVPAINGVRLRGVTQPQLKARFTLDGLNLVDGSRCIVKAWEGVISSSSAFDFMSGKFNAVPLTGRLNTPTGKTEPFEIQLPTG